MKMTKRRWGGAAAGTLIVAAAAWALVPKPIAVDMAQVSRGPLEVSIAEDGITRIRERFEVAAPVTGRLLRVEVHAGDVVGPDVPLVRMAPAPLDPKEEAQLTGRLHGAERAASEAQALLRRASDAANRAHAEAGRIRKLAAASIVSRDALEEALTSDSMAAKDQEAARFRAEATAYDVAVARAALGQMTDNEVVVRSPVRGRVLQVLHESEKVVTAGTPLILVGDPTSLEIVADFLSADAVRIRPGALARIERWGGPHPLSARVRLIEPAAFMKVSALGVEEQRVNVVCDLTDPPTTLGDQYRVDVRVILWSGQTTKGPATALFTSAGAWKVFAVRNGRARLQTVTTGEMSDTEVEIRSGLRLGDAIVVHPSDQVHEGVRISARR
ncbi:MAG TPA: HlyD family efflux transporter periplasmic adaptor subunit [Thermoanaerobaculia bacterium]|nr:HlyD family efflux transporter periplasmic adaptor subunit [Thermoanaerobaculia bacterium]